MKNRLLSAIVCAATMAAAASPGSAAAAPAKVTVAKAADAVIVRPVAFASTVVGTALFALSLPVTALTKHVRSSADALVVRPARATFTRPLGDLEALGD